MASLCVGPQI